MRRPIVVTCGEPSGIGPEVAAKAWAAVGQDIPVLWIGNPDHLPIGTPTTEVFDPKINPAPGTLAVLRHDLPGAAQPGAPLAAHAPGVIGVIERAVDLCGSGKARAMVTAPISKKALIDGAGFAFPGHTEFLADLAGVPGVAMMLVGAGLRVVPVTIHIPLADVPKALTVEAIVDTARTTVAALTSDFGIPKPRLAVSGVNPHAGEGGAIGREEIEVIGPALEVLKREGIDLIGPLPADTMFHTAARARYDAAIAMYHDQALVPLKTLAFDDGVNVTLGLPFVRTSPDHGTAFDIAGTATASPASMIAAIRLADEMARARM